MTLKDQTFEFEQESLRYIKTHKEHGINSDLILPNTLKEKKITSILDVGCGAGQVLHHLQTYFTAKRAVGIEPSVEGIELLRKTKNLKNISFESAFAHKLPFVSDSFELVTAWSVLHWIGRNEYLQSIGELIRVCSKYLLVMDFSAARDYRTPYRHVDGLYTYKQNFDNIISNSGIMRKVEVMQWFVEPNSGKIVNLTSSDLENFERNPISYYARKLVLYEKDYAFLPEKDQHDF